MSDNNINNMDVKKLRNEVQELRDELAIMKRKYEDIIYNLDDENFSSRIVKEKGEMRTAIEVNAEGIKTKVSNEEFQSEKMQTAKLISSEVTKLDNSISTKITQTEKDIRAEVKKVEEDTKNDINKTLESYTTLAMTEEKISLSASQTETFVTNMLEEEYVTKGELTLTNDAFNVKIRELNANDDDLYSVISTTSSKISAVVRGDYTENMLSNYFTGIEITPHQIKMIDDDVYSVYNSAGLRFYDKTNQIEGWAIEPSSIGGVLNYYVNGGNCYRFGSGESGDGYSELDISIKALNGQRSGFVVDVTECGYPYVKFVGLHDYSDAQNEPQILANGKKLATQNWVLENAGVGGEIKVVAIFG